MTSLKNQIKTLVRDMDFVIIPVSLTNKCPLLKNWQKLELKDSYAVMQHWMMKTDCKLNIGVVCGKKSGVFVVDIDVKDDGMKTWTGLIEKYGPVKTLYQTTPSGGLHYFFKYEDKYDNLPGTVKVNGVGIDLRTNGNQVVCEPSVYKNGSYKMNKEHEVNEMPTWLYDWINRHFEVKEQAPKTKTKTKTKNKKKQVDGKKSDVECNLTEEQLSFYRELIDCLDEKRADNRDDWMRIGFALGTISQCEEMFEIYNDFSKWCPSKYNEKACRDIFNAPNGSVTQGTICYMANQDDPKDYFRVKMKYYKCIYPSTHDRFYYTYVTNKYKKLTFDFKNESDKIKFDEITKEIADYINHYIVTIDGMPTDMSILINYKNEKERQFFFKGKNIKTLFNGCKFTYTQQNGTKTKTKHLDIYTLYKENLHIIHKLSLTFKPDKTKELPHEFNMFDRLPLLKEDVENFKNVDIGPYLDHIKNVWCKKNEVYYNYVLNWIAHTIQKPHHKTKVAIVLQSQEGAGKGIIIQKLEPAFGDYFYHITDYGKIIGNFNSSLENRLFCFLDEGVWGGQKKEIGKLKTFITELKLTINKKNVPEYQIDNRMNLIIASNEDFVIPAGKAPRRYFMLQLDDKYCGSQTNQKKEYFDKIDNVPSEAIIRFFYNRDITGFNPCVIPVTEAIQTQQEMNLDSVEEFVLQICSDSLEGINNKGDWIPKSALYDMYIERSKKINAHTFALSSFYRKLCKILSYVKRDTHQRRRKGQREIKIETETINQRYFTKYMGGRWTWDKPARVDDNEDKNQPKDDFDESDDDNDEQMKSCVAL